MGPCQGGGEEGCWVGSGRFSVGKPQRTGRAGKGGPGRPQPLFLGPPLLLPSVPGSSPPQDWPFRRSPHWERRQLSKLRDQQDGL